MKALMSLGTEGIGWWHSFDKRKEMNRRRVGMSLSQEQRHNQRHYVYEGFVWRMRMIIQHCKEETWQISWRLCQKRTVWMILLDDSSDIHAPSERSGWIFKVNGQWTGLLGRCKQIILDNGFLWRHVTQLKMEVTIILFAGNVYRTGVRVIICGGVASKGWEVIFCKSHWGKGLSRIGGQFPLHTWTAAVLMGMWWFGRWLWKEGCKRDRKISWVSRNNGNSRIKSRGRRIRSSIEGVKGFEMVEELAGRTVPRLIVNRRPEKRRELGMRASWGTFNWRQSGCGESGVVGVGEVLIRGRNVKSQLLPVGFARLGSLRWVGWRWDSGFITRWRSLGPRVTCSWSDMVHRNILSRGILVGWGARSDVLIHVQFPQEGGLLCGRGPEQIVPRLRLRCSQTVLDLRWALTAHATGTLLVASNFAGHDVCTWRWL